MRKKRTIKMVHEGEYMAEVDIELIYMDNGWSPYISLEDAQKLDEVREALRRKDFATAAGQAKIYTVSPLAV